MAKSKYTPETVKKILEGIARDGCDKSGWLAGGISEKTFYDWQNKFPQFLQEVARAKGEYKKHCPEEISKLAKTKLVDALEHGQIIKRQVTTTRTIEMRDKDGHVIWTQDITESKEHSDTMPVPKWAIERVLPKASGELEALEVLIACGWIPREVLEATVHGTGELREKITEAFKRVTSSSQEPRN